MTILILSNTSGHKTPYSEWIEEASEQVVLFCPRDKRETFHQNNYLYIKDFENYLDDDTIITTALQFNQKYHFSQVLSVSEFDVIRSAKLRELLNLPGQHLLSAEAYRNKLFMKALLKNSNVKVPEYSAIISRAHVDEFIKKHDFPVVIKPIYGTGSKKTFIVKNKGDVDKFFNTHSEHIDHFEIEKFIQGDMFHVDGLIVNNTMEYCYVSQYYTGCLAFQKNKPVSSYLLDADNPLTKALTNQAAEIIETLPAIVTSSFHVEFFVTPTKDIYLCEIASRTGGGEIGASIAFATGRLLNKEMLLSQLHLPTSLETQPMTTATAFIMFPPQDGRYRGILKRAPFPWVLNEKIFAEEGKQYHAATFSADYIASVILKGENEEQLIERIDKVIKWYDQNMIWE